jgi:hypothetical protein
VSLAEGDEVPVVLQRRECLTRFCDLRLFDGSDCAEEAALLPGAQESQGLGIALFECG